MRKSNHTFSTWSQKAPPCLHPPADDHVPLCHRSHDPLTMFSLVFWGFCERAFGGRKKVKRSVYWKREYTVQFAQTHLGNSTICDILLIGPEDVTDYRPIRRMDVAVFTYLCAHNRTHTQLWTAHKQCVCQLF